MKKLIEQQIEFLKKCLEDTADGSWSTHLNKPIQKQIDNLTEQLRLYDVSVSLPLDPMELAKYLHDNYEQIAKRTNWNTQKSCKVEFEDLPIENKNTMILLACKIILDFVGNER